MIYFFIVAVCLSLGFLFGLLYSIYEEHKLKPFRKKYEEATNEYIQSLEKTNKFWQEQALEYSVEYWKLKFADGAKEKVSK